MKTVTFVGWLLFCAVFVFLGIKELIDEKSWNDFTVKKTTVVQESLETQKTVLSLSETIVNN